tara:strand:+ start:1486 stop:2724 length:1239 start_codon:yes stop_codon:yes gene_type:complete
MISYILLFAAVILFLGSILFLQKSIQIIRAARDHHDEVSKRHDVTGPSSKKLKKVTSTYKALQKKYQAERKNLDNARELLMLYEVGSGSKDGVVFLEATKLEPIEDLEAKLVKVKANLKKIISLKTACTSDYKGNVTIDDSKAEANKYFNRDIKLRLRCLDKEFLLAQIVIDWNNVDRLKRRCRLVFDEINDAGKLMKTRISKQYFDLKLLELDLLFRIANTKKKLNELAREDRAAERQTQREEERLKAELKRVEKQREQMEKLVAQEVKRLKSTSSDDLLKIETLKVRLAELEEREARAKAMSEITRSGYVYVISNPRSFGSEFCKIGMTRRLDPMDRVRELGDASVPFEFDVHAFAYSSDAPALEKKLHDQFEESRVNLVNKRREFFFVEPSRVVEQLMRFDPDAELQAF